MKMYKVVIYDRENGKQLTVRANQNPNFITLKPGDLIFANKKQYRVYRINFSFDDDGDWVQTVDVVRWKNKLKKL